MALKEYKYGDRTFLFDSDHVPDGAELVGDIAPSVSPGPAVDGVEGVLKPKTVELAEPEADAPKGRKPANKAAAPAESK